MRNAKFKMKSSKLRPAAGGLTLHFTFYILHFAFFLSVVSLLPVLTGCASVEGQREEAAADPSYGQVSIFMSGPERASSDITFELDAVSVTADDGTDREIMTGPVSINSTAMVGRQRLLGERRLPEGTYTKIKLLVKKAVLKRKDKPANLAMPPEGIELDIRFTVTRRTNTSLFISWNSDASVAEGFMFKPAFGVKRQVPELSSLLVYVTNEESDNVSAINRQTGEVVATIMVGKRPKGIAANTKKDALRIYVANSGSNSVSVIDPTTNKVEGEIPVRFGWGAEGIAVAKIAPDKELIFVTNFSSNTVSVIDGSTYQEVEKINVGNGPVAVAVDPPADTLFSSRFLNLESFNALRNYRERFVNVYIANKNSKSVTVVKVDVSTGRSVDVISLGVEWSPVSLGVDFQRGKVYVTNYDSDKLSVIDIVKIVKGAKSDLVSTINNVGNSGIGVVADPSFERIYFLRESSNEILVIKPVSETTDTLRTLITPIIDVINAGSSPRALVLDPEGRKLFVVNRGSDNVSIIDKTTRKAEQIVPVGKRPYGITMFSR